MVNIETALAEALNAKENSWDREQATPEYQVIWEAYEALRVKIMERCSATSPEQPLETYPEMAYSALLALLNAGRDLLQNPVAVANINVPASGQRGTKQGFVNYSRNGFLHNLAQSCRELNVSGEDLNMALRPLEKL